MKLKVCGLSKTVEVETCVENKVNYCGFILNYPKSHRFISADKAKALTNIEKKETKYVGVLVSPTDKEIEAFSKLNFDFLQLYGDYNNKSLAYIKKKFNKKIIASIQVKKKSDIEIYKKIEKEADIILWDSSGYAESLDWNYQWIKNVSTDVEKMIAGNITTEKLNDLRNLADIVDVSGALETNKVKDINKIKNFISEVKRINYENKEKSPFN